MSALSAAILAVIQGLTEFLPVSSSGHLVLGEALLGSHAFGTSIAFELVVHLGTFLAVLVVFWLDIVNLIRVFFTQIIKPQSWRSGFRLSINDLYDCGDAPSWDCRPTDASSYQ